MKTSGNTPKTYISKNINNELGEQLTVGQRVADRVASFGGSWPFIALFMISLFAWMFFQTLVARNRGFDPYPYIFLNLILSCLAAIQAPVIMMSQNRHSQRDRLQADHDYEINLKAEREIERIQKELDTVKQHQELDIAKSLEEIRSLLSKIEQHSKIG